MSEHDLLAAWAEDVVRLEAERDTAHARIAELEARVAELTADRDHHREAHYIYREMVQVALVIVRRLTEIIRNQRRAANGWTREHEATMSEELLAIDAWIDTQLRHSDRSEAA